MIGNSLIRQAEVNNMLSVRRKLFKRHGHTAIDCIE